MDTIGAPDPPRPPQSVGEVLGTVRLPNDLVGYLSARLRFTWEDGIGLLLEICSGRGLHAFFRHLASGVDPAPGLERLNLLGGDQDVTVHPLYSFLSVPAGLFSTYRQLLSSPRRASLQLWISWSTASRYGAPSAPYRGQTIWYMYREPPPYSWKLMPCERVGKNQEDSQDLEFWVLTSFPRTVPHSS